jgi:hypothetical protein
VTQVLGNTRPFKSGVECSFHDALIFQSIQHTLWQLLSTGQIHDLCFFLIKGIGKQQDFKIGTVAVCIDTALPQVVDSKVQPILDQSEAYSGCYGKISVTFYGYNSNGNRGIAAGLGNIQKLKDGESLGGRTSAADDFQTEDDEDFLS